MTKPSLEFQLKPAISALLWFKRLTPLHRADKLLFGLYLLEHEPIECFVLSGCDGEQVLYDILAIDL